MKESTYNLFLYIEGGVITQLGVVVHQLEGTDQAKILRLQAEVDTDYKSALRLAPPRSLEWREYEGMLRLGRHLELFKEVFRQCAAPMNPLLVVTPIVDGSPTFSAVTGIGALELHDLHTTPSASPWAMPDYLMVYLTDGSFDLPNLLNDDYFKAIKLLFNAKHYVSAAKLLMSFLDTIAFIELGDVQGNFVTWLKNYADLGTLGITADELWEFRNGLLHMTNLHSRAVVAERVSRLILVVGIALPGVALEGEKYFNLKELVGEISKAVSRWSDTYNRDQNKMCEFVSRYDLTVSDSRMASFNCGSES